jgi:large subunit ribosomal protein L22
MKEIKVKLKNLDVAPRKARAIANVVSGLGLGDAEAQLLFRRERAAEPILKLLRSAAAGAKNQGFAVQNLFVKSCRVDKGATLKRWLPRAQGRATPIHKQRSHLSLVLAEASEKKGQFKFTGAIKAEAKKKIPKGRQKTKTVEEEKDRKDRIEPVNKPSFFRRHFQRKSI